MSDEREMDARIAEKIFGWCYWTRFGFWWFGPADEPLRDELIDCPPMLPTTREDAIQNFTPAAAANNTEKFPEPPHYSTNGADSKQLRDRLAEKFNVAVLRFQGGRYRYEVWNETMRDLLPPLLSDHFSGIDPDEFKAVALCALKLATQNEVRK